MADSRHWRSVNNDNTLLGTVKVVSKHFGFIEPDEPLPLSYKNKDVFFPAKFLHGAKLSVGDKIRFILNDHPKEKQQAFKNAETGQRLPGEKMAESRHWRSVNNDNTLLGTVKVVREHFGFIKPDEPLPLSYKNKDVFFPTKFLRGAELSVGDKVRFILNDNPKEKPQAFKVFTLNSPEGDIPVREKRQVEASIPAPLQNVAMNATQNGSSKVIQRVASKVNQGKIIKVTGNGTGYIKIIGDIPDQYKGYRETLYFDSKWLQCGGISLSVGDKVEFDISANKKRENELSAHRIKLVECGPKSDIEIYQLITEMIRNITDEATDNSGIILQMLRCDAIWKSMGACSSLQPQTISRLLDLLEMLSNQSKSSAQIFQKMLGVLLNTEFCKSSRSCFRQFVEGAWENPQMSYQNQIKKFLLMVLDHLPNKVRMVANLVKNMLPPGDDSTEHFLYMVIKKMSTGNAEDIEDLEWDELPLVPSTKELLKGPTISSEYINQVRTHGPYESVQDYMDTYFRLLREDCFSSLRTGVKKYLNNTLDLRDMNIYTGISLSKIRLGNKGGGVTLALKVTPCKKIDNWRTCTNLQFGNLLCLSPSGSFTDPIWVVVSERDQELLQTEGIIWVELVTDSNRQDDTECISILKEARGRTIMAESPTYYVAYQPVLEALQGTDPETLAFQDELVNIKSPCSPQTLDENSIKPSAKLDESQTFAFVQALWRRLSIIQGPPGTGKTFIGIHLIKHFLKQAVEVKFPILVLTYKNHALDEFTKAVLGLLPNGVARIGGRSREPELQECNLQSLKSSYSLPKEIAIERYAIQDEASAVKASVRTLMNQFKSGTEFSVETVLRTFNVPQIEKLLLGCKLHYQTKDGLRIAEKKMIKDALTKYEDALNDPEKSINELMSNIDQQLVAFVDQALKQWLPPAKTFEDIMKVEEGLTHLAAPKTEVKVEEGKECLPSEIDETDVAEEEEERLASLSIRGTKYRKEDEIRFEEQQKNVKIPYISSIAKKWADRVSVPSLTQIQDLWTLSSYDKVLIIQVILWHQKQKVERQLKDAMEKYKQLLLILEELDRQHEVSVLEDKKVIAMTITGASIHHRLLQSLKPAIIIVEEAAEVLEPQLIAVLGNWVQHMILIGDHKQLRPSVESYVLAKDYHLDLSMMERLINNNYPFATLQMQNRMLPEMAELLKDIYPDLESNENQVKKNRPPDFIPAMYFWTHEDEETHERSYSNKKEAERVVKLALLFLLQDYTINEITILAAYRGQVRLLRQMLAKAETDYPSIFTPSFEALFRDPEAVERKPNIKVHTIDMFQGDKNEIVIVSLVRSNKNGQLGFLKTVNRRCVAQSRARCGMYFVGNTNTFLMARDSCWENVIEKMDAKKLVGKKLPLHCRYHGQASTVEIESADDVPLTGICKLPCELKMECGNHACVKKCQPFHKHARYDCHEIVRFVHEECKHPAKRECCQSATSINCGEPCPSKMLCGIHPCASLCRPEHSHLKDFCLVLVQYTFPECGHMTTKKCGEQEGRLRCKRPCIKVMGCGIHQCPSKCQPSHSHLASYCEEIVSYKFPECGHITKKKCGEDESKLLCSKPCKKLMDCGIHQCPSKCQPEHSHQKSLCSITVSYKFPKCGHVTKKKCGEDGSKLRCIEPCSKQMDCGTHKCPSKCEPDHSHQKSLCTVYVRYKFPTCGHLVTKRCGEEETKLLCNSPCKRLMECGIYQCPSECQPEHSHEQSLCNISMKHKLKYCGHTIQKKCGEDEKRLCCSEPCKKFMDCQLHQCPSKCQPAHSHVKSLCVVPIQHKLKSCGHAITKQCGEDETGLTCREPCKKSMDCGIHPCPSQCQPEHIHSKRLCTVSIQHELQSCGHMIKKKCGEDEMGLCCREPCEKLMDCGEHKCPSKCQPDHLHSKILCTVPIQHKLQSCGHMIEKECGEDESGFRCKKRIQSKFKECPHYIVIECWWSKDKFKCKEPCTRKLPCTHPCAGVCGDTCDASSCRICEQRVEIDRKNILAAEERERERARERAQQELVELVTKNSYLLKQCHIQVLLPEGDTASEFIDVCDRVQRYVQPKHNWFPEVSRIEKITNLKLYENWLQAKSKMFDPTRVELKFHGTGDEGIEGIVRHGFRLPETEGMYGLGVYFATDSSKSAQRMYTKNSNKLLLCDVLLGKSLTVDSAKPKMRRLTLKMMGYDSLYAKRETRGKGGVLFDEYVIYDPAQALPKYIIHYGQSTLEHMSLWMGIPRDFEEQKLTPKRQYDPNDPLDFHFRLAESQFLRLTKHHHITAEVKSVDFYQSPLLIKRFNEKEKQLKAKYPSGDDSKPILAFHGTPAVNIPSIVRSNFNMSRNMRGVYGADMYFSEFPDVSIGYAQGANKLILCQLLPGRSYQCPGPMHNAPLEPDYDSHIVSADDRGRGQMVVIYDSDQVLPTYVINY